MFSMLPTPAHSYNQSHYYTPAVSSPLSSSPLRRSLSPRDPNVPSPPRASFSKLIMPPTPTPSKTSRDSPNNSASSSRESRYSKRVTKTNPLIHGRSGRTGADGRETRRKLFLKRVREDSEDKRWNARGGDDEMMRSIWIAEQRRREERQRREALGLDALPVEEEDFLSLNEIMADEVTFMEQAELEALAAMMNEKEGGQQEQMYPEEEMHSSLIEMDEQDPTTNVSQGQQPETPYGSDDDEYDHIFMDVIQEENRMATQSSQAADGDHDMMDMD